MPNGKLLIGTGYGDATVNNSQPAVQSFINVLAKQQAKRDAEKQALVQQMGALKTDGLREGDKENYYNAYNDWKNTAIQANNAPANSRQKLDLQGLAAQKYNQLNNIVNTSKQYGQYYHEGANQLHNDSMRHQFTDDAVDKYLSVKDLPYNSPEFQQYGDLNKLERQVDNTKVDDAIEKAKNQALSIIPAQRFQSNGTEAGRNGIFVENRKVIPFDGENGVYHRLLNATSASPDFKKSLDSRYRSIQGESPDETNALRVRQYAIDKGYDKGWIQPVGTKEFKQSLQDQNNNAFNQHARLRQYDINNPMSDGEPTTPPPAHDINIPFNSGNPGKEGIIQAKGYIPLSIPNKNFAGSPAYSLTNGKAVPALESSGSYGIVGVGNFPIIKGTGTKLDGTIAQPNYSNKNPQNVQLQPMIHVQSKDPNTGTEDYVIPYDKLPENIKNSKPVKQALSGFQPADQTQIPVTTGTRNSVTPKTITKVPPIPKNTPYKGIVNVKNAKGDIVQIGVKNGKWYYVKTNKEVDEPL